MFQDFKFIFKKPMLLTSLLVISLLPVIYASIFLGAMWNPYDRTDDMAFHVVNEDKGNEDIDLGAEIEEELKRNDQLDWQFTDLNEAKKALQKGDSYGYLRIPEDASDNAMTFLSDDPKPVDMVLKTNPGHNFIGSIMSEQAGSMLTDTVKTSITETYTSTLIGQLNDLSEQSDEAKQALADLKNGAHDLNDGLIEAEESTAQLNQGSAEVNEGAAQLSQSSKALHDGETQFTGQLEQFSPILGNNAQAVLGAQRELEDGAGQIEAGSSQLAQGASELNSGLSQLESGTGNLVEGSGELAGALDEIDTRFNEVLSQLDENDIAFTEDGAKAIATPVNLDIESIVDTQNYAQSFAPLIIAVSLFIGSITFNVVYPMNKIFEDRQSVLRQWVSRISLFLSHALLMSTLLYIVIVWIMQIEIASHGKFFLAMLVWSTASIAMIGLLVMIFGNFGKFLGIVLLIIQLSSSAGTFPIETSSDFYQGLYQVVPMAFVVTGFRDAVFNQGFDYNFSTVIYVLLVTILAAFILISLVLLLKNKMPKYEEKVNKLSKFES